MRQGKSGKVAGAVLLSWWIILLVIFGLGGNAFLIFKALQAGNITATVMFGAFFAGACVYLYRTYNASDEIRGNFKD